MKNIQGIKVGNTVNLSIDGKLYKKSCGTPKEADELFKLVLDARKDPSDKNVKRILIAINEKTRIALVAGLETDVEMGEVYLSGFSTPIPDTLVEVIKEYHEKGYPLDAIMNFWKLLMINPDKRVRTSLFDFIKTHDFVLTTNGYMVVYKAVAYKDRPKTKDEDVREFVSNKYLYVKTEWKCSPNKYMVYRNLEDNQLGITKVETASKWDEKEKNVKILGKLGELNAVVDTLETEVTYTDKHSHKMCIEIGKPVLMERKDCDSDPARDCSYGLHVGATSYVQSFGNSSDAVLVCYVNPAHVVAVPDYDHSKMRVAEYFPFALANYDGEKIQIVEQSYFESDYQLYEEQELADMIEKVKSNEPAIQTAKNATPDAERDFVEIQKILETRLLDLK